jgi:hypothetical protein
MKLEQTQRTYFKCLLYKIQDKIDSNKLAEIYRSTLDTKLLGRGDKESGLALHREMGNIENSESNKDLSAKVSGKTRIHDTRKNICTLFAKRNLPQ